MHVYAKNTLNSFNTEESRRTHIDTHIDTQSLSDTHIYTQSDLTSSGAIVSLQRFKTHTHTHKETDRHTQTHTFIINKSFLAVL